MALTKVTSGTITDSAVTAAKIADGTVVAAEIADDAIVAAKIADDAVTTAKILDANVTTAKIAADAIDGTKLADNACNSEHYTDGSIDLAHMSSESVDEDNLHISNAGTNGQFLSKQSGNTGGLTWADAAGGAWEYVSTSSSGTARDFRNIFNWSTYPCWMFVFNGIAMDNAGGGLGVRFYNASDVLSTSGYKWNYAVLHSNSSSWAISNSNSDSFMHLSNYPSNGAPLWCNLLVWYGGTRNTVTADCVWDHTHGSNYWARSVAGGRQDGFQSTGIHFKQWAGVFQGGDIYAYRLKKS